MKHLPFVLLPLILMATSCNKQLKTDFENLQKEHEAVTAQLRDSVQLLSDEKIALGLDYGRLLEQTNLMEGVFFEVQIGAFQYFDLSKYRESFVRLRNDEQAGLNKYVLGRFIDYRQAQNFKADIQQIGVEDAFIVGYVDGQRVEINQALKAARNLYGLN